MTKQDIQIGKIYERVDDGLLVIPIKLTKHGTIEIYDMMSHSTGWCQIAGFTKGYYRLVE